MIGMYKGNQKAYIDYDLGIKECLDCNNILPISKFESNGSGGKYKPICIDCRYVYSWARQQDKKINAEPHKYCECHKCGKIQHIRFKHCRECGLVGKRTTLDLTEGYGQWN